MMSLLNEIVHKIKTVLSYSPHFIALHEPYFDGNEWEYVKECLDTGWVSSVGKFVDRFEQDLANFTGAKYAVATVNGTAALHICYLLAGVKTGNEVLIPTLSFVATANALSYCGAIPHFIEAEDKFLGIDVNLLDQYLNDITEIKNNVCINKLTGRHIQALCVMHTLGHPVDLDRIVELCKKYHLTLIEDAAEALGSYYKGIHVGHRGLVGALSFNGNKIITTGGGGAILTNDANIAKQAKHMTTTAKLPHPWLFEHDKVGYNYRLPNINAALGCAQLEQLPKFLNTKRLLAKKYKNIFLNLQGLRFIQEPDYAKSNYWLNALLLDSSFEDSRDSLLELLNKSNVMSRPIWNLLHTLPMYKDSPRMTLSVAEALHKRLIKIPSSVILGTTHSKSEAS
ncbi:MAG: hypothetical protein ACD_46C00181G0043 [uncultured bacterium]|nr:MAG: hypothetical protein ACD_46C00181G0043 [uncultured bacterium]